MSGGPGKEPLRDSPVAVFGQRPGFSYGGPMSLTYFPRSAWTMRASRGPTALRPAGLQGIALHWPGMGNRRLFALADVAHALRGWQDDHMDNPKKLWSDIAYQVAVDQAGRVWTLRGLLTRSAANGDEAANLAYGAILLVLGNGESPTGAMINATRETIADFRRLYPKATEIRPHSAVRVEYTGSGTDCPGDAVRGLIAAGRFDPVNVPPTTHEGSPVTQLDRIEKLLTALALAETNRYADSVRRVQTLTTTEAGRYQDYVHRFNAIMGELADDPASPVTATDVLPPAQSV